MSTYSFTFTRLVSGTTLLILLFLFPGKTLSSWKDDWDRTIKAAEQEGSLTIYGGRYYDEFFAEFEKKYPKIKVVSVTGRGSEIGPRLVAERRVSKYLADLFLTGSSTLLMLYQAKALDPIKPTLLLPEVLDESKWWEGKHRYSDPEAKYIFGFNGILRVDAAYNKNLLNPMELRSFWDLLQPKWKGTIVAFDPAMAPTRNSLAFFYHNRELGPKFLRRLFSEMDVTLSRNIRQIADWLGVGKFAISLFTSPTNSSIQKPIEQGLPLGTFTPGHFREGAAFLTSEGNVALLNRAPHPNAAKVAINWLLSRQGQIAYQKFFNGLGEVSDSLRTDIPKDEVAQVGRRKEGMKYLDVGRPEWQDIKAVRTFIEEARAKAGK